MSTRSDLQAKTGYAFRDAALLDMALTHASVHGKKYDNERLEFLGDRVLGLVAADMLYRAYPAEDEGSLAKRHTALVRQATLVAVAEDLSLAGLVRVSGDARRDAVLSDAVEALIGAVYLDGGYAAAEKMVRALWQKHLSAAPAPPEDPKSALQEWAQARGLGLPSYAVLGQSGPDHAPVFDVSVCLGDRHVTASASSKRAAEKDAAAQLLAVLEREEA